MAQIQMVLGIILLIIAILIFGLAVYSGISYNMVTKDANNNNLNLSKAEKRARLIQSFVLIVVSAFGVLVAIMFMNTNQVVKTTVDIPVLQGARSFGGPVLI